MDEPNGSDADRGLRQARLFASTMCWLHGVTMVGMWLLFATAFVRGNGAFIEHFPFAPSATAQGAIWTLRRGWVLLLLLPLDYEAMFRLARSGRPGMAWARRLSFAVFAGLLALPTLIGPELVTEHTELMQEFVADYFLRGRR
jgi:hypothetical protein